MAVKDHMVSPTHIPRTPLSDFVEVFWQYDGLDPSHARERCVPTGTMEIVVDLRDDEMRAYDRRSAYRPQKLRGPLVCGAHSGFFVIDTTGQASTIGVHFKPGGAFPFLAPAGELGDALVPLESLWGAKAAKLRDRLLDAATAEAKFSVLEQTLLARTTRLPGRHPAVAFALGRFESVPQRLKVSDVARWSGLSQRRFIRVGLTPKLFCRIQRFQRVLHLVENGRGTQWAEVALRVRDLLASRRFYKAALASLRLGLEFEHEGLVAFGSGESGRLIIYASERPVAGFHVAFSAPSREAVDRFHAAALEAGGRDNGAPGLIPEYHEGYYGAYVFDPDGNNIEAVHHTVPPDRTHDEQRTR
jgi:catechol 2,3-dioxygenase-like lactoylglutathione lyase family enzyme